LGDSRLGYARLGDLNLGEPGPVTPITAVRQTQEALEWAGTSTAANLRQTQAAVEWAGTMPAATGVNQTQVAVEHMWFPPNEAWATQVCLEVVLSEEPPPEPEPARRNWLYSGGLAHT